MRRGEIWTMAGGPDYAGKPRPVVVIQSDLIGGTRSVIVCSFTSDPLEIPNVRIAVEPSTGNGLRTPSRLMLDKIASIPHTKLGRRIGELERGVLSQLEGALLVILDLRDNHAGA